MNRFTLFSAALVATLAAAPMPTPAAATEALLRCRAPDGTIGYTDRSCAVLGARAVPIPGELMSRIAREQAREPDGVHAAGSWLAASLPATSDPGRRSPASGCARTPVQLAMDLHGALALGDVNRVAESYHFAGMSNDAGERTLDRLRRLVGHQVIDSRYFDASITDADADGATVLAGPGSASAGMLQLVLGNGDGGVSAVDFDVHRYAGCYFVSF
jgi:hypothetical protein